MRYTISKTEKKDAQLHKFFVILGNSDHFSINQDFFSEVVSRLLLVHHCGPVLDRTGLFPCLSVMAVASSVGRAYSKLSLPLTFLACPDGDRCKFSSERNKTTWPPITFSQTFSSCPQILRMLLRYFDLCVVRLWLRRARQWHKFEDISPWGVVTYGVASFENWSTNSISLNFRVCCRISMHSSLYASICLSTRVQRRWNCGDLWSPSIPRFIVQTGRRDTWRQTERPSFDSPDRSYCPGCLHFCGVLSSSYAFCGKGWSSCQSHL